MITHFKTNKKKKKKKFFTLFRSRQKEKKNLFFHNLKYPLFVSLFEFSRNFRRILNFPEKYFSSEFSRKNSVFPLLWVRGWQVSMEAGVGWGVVTLEEKKYPENFAMKSYKKNKNFLVILSKLSELSKEISISFSQKKSKKKKKKKFYN
jgi:hypothetical protein